MKVGIVGCGAIANIIVDNITPEENIEFKYFYDKDTNKSKELAKKANGILCNDLSEMLNHVDLVLEAASQESLQEIAIPVLEHTNLMNMSIGALMDNEFRTRMKETCKKHNTNMYAPSGAVIGIDGLKAACIGDIESIKLTTRKSPKSLSMETEECKTLFKGKASEAVKKYPKNMNVAATLSLSCKRDIDVEIIVDPNVDRNIHEVHVIGNFGEFKTITCNQPSKANPKTSHLAALSAIQKLRSINKQFHIGTWN
mgnify:CR=1 FL=1